VEDPTPDEDRRPEVSRERCGRCSGDLRSRGAVRNVEDRNALVKRLTKTAREHEWYDHYFVAEIDERAVGRVILEAAYFPYSELIS
jgi:hypothetical protein